MAFKFRGFSLIKLVRATTKNSPNSTSNSFFYEVELYPKASDSNPIQLFLPVSKVNSEYSNFLRMEEGLNTSRYAIQSGTNPWQIISEDEFNNKLDVYKA